MGVFGNLSGEGHKHLQQSGIMLSPLVVTRLEMENPNILQ